MKESVRVVRFALIGTLNALIIAAVVFLMMNVAGDNYLLSNVVAYVIAQIHNFLWSKYWIFTSGGKYKKSNTWRQVLLFVVAFTAAYVSQFLFLVGVVEGLQCNEYLGQFLGLFIYGAINFLMNRRLTFG